MADIVRESFNSAANAASLTQTVNAPSGIVSGNVLVCSISFNGAPGTVTSPTDWVQVAYEAGASNPRIGLYRKIAAAGEPSTYSWTLTTSVACGMVIARYSNVDNTTPGDVTAVASFSAAAVSAFNLTGVTIQTAGAMLIACMGVNSATTVITEASTLVTEVAEVGGKRCELDDGVQASAGATGTVNYTFGASRACAGIVWALRPVSGTQFTQSVSGAITPSGTINKQGQKGVSGVVNSSGVAIKLISTAKTGTLSMAGTALKQVQRALSGALTSAGAISVSRLFIQAMTGVLSSSGALTKQALHNLSGNLTSGGALIKATYRSLTGSLSTAGTLVANLAAQMFYQAISGTLSAVGTLTKQTQRSISGGLASDGQLSKRINKLLTGTVTFSGAVSQARIFLQILSGQFSMTGQLSRKTSVSQSGSLTSSGQISKTIFKWLSGILSSLGQFTGELLVTWISTPASRTLSVSAETRIFQIPPENRTLAIQSQSRIFLIPPGALQ